MNEATGQPSFRAGIENPRGSWHDPIYIMRCVLLQIEKYRRVGVLADG